MMPSYQQGKTENATALVKNFIMVGLLVTPESVLVHCLKMYTKRFGTYTDLEVIKRVETLKMK